jgi:antirestriction protein ArdC
MSLITDERAARRAADRQLLTDAVHALTTSEGWQRWLHARRAFHHYSLHNQLLIALQAPDATHVASFRAWLKLGYCVRRGEKALRIWAPVPPTKRQLREWRDDGADPKQRPRVRFRLVPVFDRAQVDPLPDHPGGPAPLEPPHHLIEGDDLAHLLHGDGPLRSLCSELGVTLAIEPIRGGAHGYYEPDRRRIVLADALPPNHQVKTAIHELAHALVRLEPDGADAKLSYAQEELVAETVAFTVTGALGIDAGGYSVAYLASWSQGAELATVQETAALIDRLARRIEDAVLAPQRLAADSDQEHSGSPGEEGQTSAAGACSRA